MEQTLHELTPADRQHLRKCLRPIDDCATCRRLADPDGTLTEEDTPTQSDK